MEEKTYFITFEGIDGCGKDTQIHRLVEAIREDDNYPFGNKYSRVWITREPTKITQSGIKISNLIRQREVSANEATEAYIKDRKEHSLIIKQFLKYSHVISSRYDVSTLTYQTTQGMDLDYLIELHQYGKEGGTLIPDLTIILDIPADVAFERTQNRDSVLECFEKIDFQRKLVETEKKVIEKLRKLGRNIIIVNSNQPKEEVTKQMLEKISKALAKEDMS